MLTNATESYGGTVFHLAGDGMMAGFGVDGEIGNGAREALAAGHAMLRDFAPIAARWRSELAIEAGIGVGLHLGEVAVGVLGPPRHQGDHLGRRYRQCRSAALQPGTRRRSVVLLHRGRRPREQCGGGRRGDRNSAAVGAAPFLQLPQFELRGRRGPIDIWCVPAAERLAL